MEINFSFIVIIFLYTSLLALNIYPFIIALKGAFRWNIDSNKPSQLKLQKEIYLFELITLFTFIVKIILFFYIFYAIDEASDNIVGAMCAAGVFNSFSGGYTFLALLIINLIFGSYLIYANILNLQDRYRSYSKINFKIYLLFFIMLSIETFLALHFLENIKIDKIASCCGSIYTDELDVQGLVLKISHLYIFIGFVVSSILLLISLGFKNRLLSAIFGVIFFVGSIFSIIYLFSPYIYELPTHMCPFCILQSEYNYIGYFIYLFLFLSLFFSTINLFLSLFFATSKDNFYKIALICTVVAVLILCFYPINYYIKNGVFL